MTKTPAPPRHKPDESPMPTMLAALSLCLCMTACATTHSRRDKPAANSPTDLIIVAAPPIAVVPATPCPPPVALPNRHRVSASIDYCTDPAVPFAPSSRRPFVVLSVPLATSQAPIDLPGLHEVLAAIAPEAPEPNNPDRRMSIHAAALRAGLEIAPTTRAGQVGWVAYLPHDPTPASVDRAVSLLLALVGGPTFGAALVATTAEQLQHLSHAPSPDAMSPAAAWAASLAAGHARRTHGPMDTRGLALFHREDLARLHRLLFTSNVFSLRVSGATLPEPARARFSTLSPPTTPSNPEPPAPGACPAPSTRSFSLATSLPPRRFAALAAAALAFGPLAAALDLLRTATIALGLKPPLLFVIDDIPFVIVDPDESPAIVALLTRNAERLEALDPRSDATAPSWSSQLIALFATAAEAVTVTTHPTGAPPTDTIAIESLRCPARR